MNYQQKIDAASLRVATARASGGLSQEASPETELAAINDKTKGSALAEVAISGVSAAASVFVAAVLVGLLFIIGIFWRLL